METTFRLGCDGRMPLAPAHLSAAFQDLAEMVCRECGGGCQGFRLMEDLAAYEHHPGLKIGWVVEEKIILLRLANCEFADKPERIAPLLGLFGLNVIESRLVQ